MVIKKMFCPTCEKHYDVEDGTYFCEICGGLLKDTGKREAKAETKKPSKAVAKKIRDEFKTQTYNGVSKNNVKLLYGEPNMAKAMEKKYTSRPQRFLKTLSIILFFIAFILYTDNRTETLVAEWNIFTNLMTNQTYTKSLYFLSQENYDSIVSLLLVSCLFSGVAQLGLGIRQARLYSVVARKLNSEQSGVQYLEGLASDKLYKINTQTTASNHYTKISTLNKIVSALMCILAIGTIIIGILIGVYLTNQYETILEIYIQKIRYEQFDKNSDVYTLFAFAIVQASIYVLYLIMQIVYSVVGKKAKTQAENLIKSVEGI